MRVNITFSTITAGSPVNAVTGTTSAPGTNTPPVYATRMFVQALHSATVGLAFVLDGGNAGRVPAASASGDLVAELSAASATAPGGSYSDSDPNPAGGIDLRLVWIDVAVTNTPVKLSYDLKN